MHFLIKSGQIFFLQAIAAPTEVDDQITRQGKWSILTKIKSGLNYVN